MAAVAPLRCCGARGVAMGLAACAALALCRKRGEHSRAGVLASGSRASPGEGFGQAAGVTGLSVASLCGAAARVCAAPLAAPSQAWRNQQAPPCLHVFPLLKFQHRSPLEARRAFSVVGAGLPLPLPLPLPLGGWAGALG